jgi:radical SAM superfamily enzyme YgiQ (UPF0313 family)
MKNILINPPQNTIYPQPPPGLASIAAVLELNGHQAEIMDANALQPKECEIANKVKGADVIGIKAMTPAVNSAIRIAKEMKAENPDKIMISGGTHSRKLPYMAMMTSRGCPYKCICGSKPILGQKFVAQRLEITVD